MKGKKWIVPMVVGSLAAQALAAPRLWSDDFTSEKTYDYASWLAPCYGGPSTKYTVFEAYTGDFVNEHAVSEGGSFRISSRVQGNSFNLGRLPLAVVGSLNLGQGCPDVVGTPYYLSTEPFTSSNLCIYGAIGFTPWDLREMGNGGAWWDRHVFGEDLKAGIANIDDDTDGVTDNINEALAKRPTTVNNGYGHPGPNAYQAGFDAAPGIAAVDDDANGTTDEYGEIGHPGTDDGDDAQRRRFRHFLMKGAFETSSFVTMNIDPSDQPFSIREAVAAQDNNLESSDEFFPGSYQPGVCYNWVFCASGTCFGAMLWTEDNLSNPDETVGPVTTTKHTAFVSNAVAFNSEEGGDADEVLFIRQTRYMGNSTFGDTFWVISGDARTFFPPITADFDGDHDVDGQDFMKFSKCFNGSLRPPKATCENPEANFDGDIDVDGQDFMAFSKCFNGSLRRPKCLPPILTNCGP